MTLTVGTRRRAAEFARALEGEPTEDRALARLVMLTERLEPLPVEPPPPFRAALRRRLVAVAAVRARAEDAADASAAGWRPGAVPAASPGTTRLRRLAAPRRLPRLSIAVGALAAVTTVSGIGVAGSRSLPGDPFYGVKRAAESVQLQVAGSDAARGSRYLQFAATRLSEVEALSRAGEAALPAAHAGRPVAGGVALGGPVHQRVADALRAMDEDTRRGTRLLSKAYGEHRDPELASRLSRFQTSQRRRLAALVPELPPEAQPPAAGSLGLLSKVGTRADALHAGVTCTAGCPGGEDLGTMPASSSRAPVTGSPTPRPGAPTGPGLTPAPTSPGVPTPPTSGTAPAPVAPGPTSAPSTGGPGASTPAPSTGTPPSTVPGPAPPTTKSPRSSTPSPSPPKSPSASPTTASATASATEGGPRRRHSGLPTPSGPGLSLPPAGPQAGSGASAPGATSSS